MKTISIVGFGRFGQTLYRLLKDDFKIILYNRNSKRFNDVVLSKNTVIAKHITDIYKSKFVTFKYITLIRKKCGWISEKHITTLLKIFQ